MTKRRRSPGNSYISVRWIHADPDEPILLVSELSSARMELRKIEYFKSGKVGTASLEHERRGTRLGTEPVPELKEINADPQFVAEEISEAEFNAQWDVYV
jgi:hypothetical protein